VHLKKSSVVRGRHQSKLIGPDTNTLPLAGEWWSAVEPDASRTERSTTTGPGYREWITCWEIVTGRLRGARCAARRIRIRARRSERPDAPALAKALALHGVAVGAAVVSRKPQAREAAGDRDVRIAWGAVRPVVYRASVIGSLVLVFELRQRRGRVSGVS